jgi:hypothetical protein
MGGAGPNGAGTGNGGGKKGPAKGGPRPSGDPPGGCRLAYTSPAATVQGLNMLGYTPMAEIWGPDQQLGTFDAEVDPEVLQFQLDYNDASRTGFLGPNAGGLDPDGLVGKCLMAAMEHVVAYVGAAGWQDRYGARGLGGIGG